MVYCQLFKVSMVRRIVKVIKGELKVNTHFVQVDILLG